MGEPRHGASASSGHLSVNRFASARDHFELGRKLRVLREHGVLIFGSGNAVHNLARVDWNEDVIRFEQAGTSSSLALYRIGPFCSAALCFRCRRRGRPYHRL